MNQDHWVIGMHPVEALLRNNPAGTVKKLYLQAQRNDKRLKEIQKLAVQAHIPVVPLDKQALSELLGSTKHQGVAVQLSAVGQHSWQEQDLDHIIQDSVCPFFLILDGVTDPHNLGACLRSANGAGVDAVIVPKDNAAGLNPTVRKVASGAAELTPLVRVSNLARTIRKLKENGLWIVGAADQESQLLYTTDLSGPLAIVLGAEGKGLRKLTRDLCDYSVSIPMRGQVPSLNVSVAAGVCLFEAVRQRSARSGF